MRETSARLAEIVEQARSILTTLDEATAAKPLLAGGWSSKQVIGHLIDSASNNHQRFVRAALEGGLVWPSYDQTGCVRVQAFQDAPWPLLVEVWTALNRLLVHVLAHLPASSASAPCRIGGEGEMPLGDLARAYVSHLEHHLEQLGIARAASAQG